MLLLFTFPVTGLNEGESLFDKSDAELNDDEDELSEEVELHRDCC